MVKSQNLKKIKPKENGFCLSKDSREQECDLGSWQTSDYQWEIKDPYGCGFQSRGQTQRNNPQFKE